MEKLTRRNFLLCSTAFLCTPVTGNAFGLLGTAEAKQERSYIKGKIFKNDAPKKLWKWSKEGFLYKKADGKRVVCGICPNRCVLSPGDRSICRSKVNIDGILYTLAYGNPCSVHVDPVEKKPLYHFKPRTKSFSIAATGCNFRCLNCQNWEISQAKPEEVRHFELFPPDVIRSAKDSGSISIAYTYSEAITFFEYMIDIARLAKGNGLDNLLISNGYINNAPLLTLSRVLDGANINLKAFDDTIYKKLNGGRLQPVLNTLKTLNEQDVHFEITNLVVPEYVDDPEMVKKMCNWIVENIGPDHPLHFLRFAPRYKLDRLPPTPVSTLTRFRELAMKEGLRYVYVGNVPFHEGNNTFCHNCKKMLIERKGYHIPSYNMEAGRCKFCKSVIPGVWETTVKV